MVWTIVVALSMSLAALLVLLQGFKKGLFENVEDVKYQVFRDEDR